MTIKMYYETMDDLSPIIKYLRRVYTVPFGIFPVFYKKCIFFTFTKDLEVLINPTTFTYITGKLE